MNKEKLMPSVVLGAICIIVAGLLAVVNLFTGPIIEAANNAAANEALLKVLPEGKDFKEMELGDGYPEVVDKGWSANGGFVFQMTVTGKSSGMIVMCGVDSDGKVVGTKVIAEQETDSYDVNVFPNVEGTDGKYKGMTLDSFDPYLVSGATLTSRAYGEAVKAALQSFVIANGGSVDTRTPEEILQDNCNAALGTTDLAFTKWLALATFDGIDAVYESSEGRVYVMGESFVGVKKDGSVPTADVTEENKASATSADAAINAITLEDVEKPADAKEEIVSIKKTSDGVYLFELSAKGYKSWLKKEWNDGDGTPISIKLSISADGKIIDVLTTAQKETAGLGDACATEDYYSEWRGASDDQIVISTGPIDKENTDIGAIAGATKTSNGYQNAIKAAFAAFKTLTSQVGGN